MGNLGSMRMENVTPPHSKFYVISFSIDDRGVYLVETKWGRIHSRGRYQNVKLATFTTSDSAYQYIRKVIKRRRDHGYYVVGIPNLQMERDR